MSDIWNLWDLKPPPVCSVKTELHFKGISLLSEVTFDALKTVRDLGHFDKEAAILSRFLYKYKRIFRHDKGIQNLVKVNQCLKRYLKLDMSSILFSFKQSLPCNINKKATVAYLPTKQMLMWVLLRLQAFAQLFVRVIELTKATGSYVYKKLNLCWSLNLSLVAFCISARILATAKFLVAKAVEWYDSFYKCLPHLRETAKILPGYDLPTDLKAWLGIVDLVPLGKHTLVDDIFELIDLANENDEEAEGDEDNEVKIVNEKFMKTLFKVKSVKTDSDIEEIIVEKRDDKWKGVKRPFGNSLSNEDVGVPVDGIDGEEEEKEVLPRRGKRFKKRREGKKAKWRKSMGKSYTESSSSNRRAPFDSSHSCLTID